MEVGGKRHAPAALPPGKTRYPLYRPEVRSGQVRKISPPLGFDPRTIQSVASHYTNYAMATIMWNRKLFSLKIKKRNFRFFVRLEFILGSVAECSNEHWRFWHVTRQMNIIKMRYKITERRKLRSSFNLLKINFLWMNICIITQSFIFRCLHGARWPKLLVNLIVNTNTCTTSTSQVKIY